MEKSHKILVVCLVILSLASFKRNNFLNNSNNLTKEYFLTEDRKLASTEQSYQRLSGDNSANSLLMEGHEQMKKQNYDLAIEKYDRAIEIDPSFEVAFNNRAMVKIILQDYQGAFDDASKAIEIDPEFSSPYNIRCNAGIGLGNYQQALSDANQTILLTKNNDSGYICSATTYIYLKEYPQAIDSLNKAIEINPIYTYYLARANVFYQMGDIENTKKDCLQAFELKKDIDHQDCQALVNN